MAQFSGAIRVADLNDYIAPAQSCVVALNGSKLKVQNDEESGQVAFEPNSKLQRLDGTAVEKPHWTQAQAPAPGEAIKVTLHDCLACSGCVTSAETVLLESQSGQELMAKLGEAVAAGATQEGPVVVVSVSPQSRAALASFYSISPEAAFSRLSSWLRLQGAAAVLDVCDGRDLALLEAASEFILRYRSSQECSTSAQAGPRPRGSQRPAAECLPLLASACPGWVCYAEKTHGEFILPYMSTTKSPQAVMGSLVKRLLASRLGCESSPARLYHATIMPCYDKKLEASREELTLPENGLPEVDCCLTTSEIQKLLEESGVTHLEQVPLVQALQGSGAAPQHATLASMLQGRDAAWQPHGMQPPLSTCADMDVEGEESGREDVAPGPAGSGGVAGPARTAGLFGPPGAGASGGYMEFIFRSAARELFGMDVPAGPLPLKSLRNADFQELSLEAPDGSRTLLRCALVYGFRNIQSIMRKIKAGKCEYHYVEVMACPSGCLNGGGQLKPQEGQTAAQLLERLEQAYNSEQVSVSRPAPASNPDVAYIYSGWLGGSPGSASAQQLLHTSYRKRERTVGVIASDW